MNTTTRRITDNQLSATAHQVLALLMDMPPDAEGKRTVTMEAMAARIQRSRTGVIRAVKYLRAAKYVTIEYHSRRYSYRLVASPDAP